MIQYRQACDVHGTGMYIHDPVILSSDLRTFFLISGHFYLISGQFFLLFSFV